MASAVDIANLALSHLGDEASVTAISPPDGSPQSKHCGRFYPMARDALLEMRPWTFATRRAALAEVADNPVADDWSYAYALPSGCLRPLALQVPGAPERTLGTGADSDAGTYPHLVESTDNGSKILYTNVEGAYLRFIASVTDTTKFTPGFVLALSRLLASYLAGPIIKGEAGMLVAQAQLKIFEAEFAKAAAADANTGTRHAYRDHRPLWLAGRATPAIPDAWVDRG